jgi:abequosyltransferase
VGPGFVGVVAHKFERVADWRTARMANLSICIPTYNRSTCLAQLLDSIIAQSDPPFEIVISDDASPDNTEEVVTGYKKLLPNLKYVRQEKNIGLDRNFVVVVGEASGDYVWLMGDDDRLEPDAIRNVLDALGNWPGVTGMTLGVIDYDHDLQTPVGIRTMPPTTLLFGAEEVFGTIVDLLGFMSATVVDRQLWNTVCQQNPIHQFENLYVQVYIMGKMMGGSGAWGVLNTPCVGFRTSNDQFRDRLGWFKRMKVDVLAYDQIAKALFEGKPAAYFAMRRKVFNTHVVARVRNEKRSESPTSDLLEATKFLFHEYKNFGAFWYSVLPILWMPKSLVRLIRKFYQRYSKSSGARRAKLLISNNSTPE